MAFGPVSASGGLSRRSMEEIGNGIQAVQEAAAAALKTHTSAENPHGVTTGQIRAVPTDRKINGKPLSGDINLSASDVGAVPVERKVNGKPLSGDVTLAASDVGAVPVERTINGKPLSGNLTLNFSDLGGSVFHAGTTAPTNKGLLWIDTTANTGGLKYHNGTAWVHVPVSST